MSSFIYDIRTRFYHALRRILVLTSIYVLIATIIFVAIVFIINGSFRIDEYSISIAMQRIINTYSYIPIIIIVSIVAIISICLNIIYADITAKINEVYYYRKNQNPQYPPDFTEKRHRKLKNVNFADDNRDKMP